MRVLFDTCCLASFFLQDHHYSKALDAIERLVRGDMQGCIAALSLPELYGSIRRQTTLERTREVQEKVGELIERGLLAVVPLTVPGAEEAGEIALSASLKGGDAVIVHAARSAQAKLFTFDIEMKKKARGLVDFF